MRHALRCACLLFVAGCVDQRPSPTDGLVTTLEVQLLAPSAGSPAQPNLDRQATVTITARGDDGQPYPGDALADLFVSYGGVRSGLPVACGLDSDAPIESFTLRGGVLANHDVKLPIAFGSTAIWVEERGSHVIGASTPIYFPNPTIPDVQTPPDLMAANATFCTSFEKKFVTMDHPVMPTGDLLVESVFGGAITITDTSVKDYRSIYLFTFGRPARDLVPGRHIKSFSGNLSKFNGFTELNFPIIDADDDAPVEPNKLPAPIKLTQGDIPNIPKMTAANTSTVEITGKVCPMLPPNPSHDTNIQKTIDQWNKYNTFILGVFSCDSFNEFSVSLPSKVVGTFDPTSMIGQSVTLRGMLKNASGQNNITDDLGNAVMCTDQSPCATGTCTGGICKKGAYNFWTVAVRGPADISL